MKVLKFGGSSVATPQRIKGVADIVRNLKTKKDAAVVFSAFGGVTDDLINSSKLAAQRNQDYLQIIETVRKRHLDAITELGLKKDKSLSEFIMACFDELSDLLHGVYLVKEISARTNDFISGHGEVLSAKIISSYFNSVGIPSSFVDARTLICTNEQFGSARVDFTTTNKNIVTHFKKIKGIGVITGFIGATSNGEMTTLGRGGSDYSAAIFGAALKASEIQIWTDVDGVMTADPRKVKKAFCVPTMTYTEAMELSHFGAKVIHPPTIQPALDKGIPLWIKNTFRPHVPGTLISVKATNGTHIIKGISSIDDITLLTMQGSGMVGVTGISGRLFNALSQASINVILITQGSSEHTISFAVKPDDAHKAAKAIESAFELEIKAKLIDKLRIENNLSIVAVIGENMRNQPGVSGRLFQALGNNGISVVATAQGSSELNISVVIHKKDLVKALNSLHQGFFLSDVKTLNVFLVGTGLIGSTLLNQIYTHATHIRKNKSLEICLAGISNSKKMYFNQEGISICDWKNALENGEKADIKKFIQQVQSLNLPQSIIVDCTGGDIVAPHYETILSSSISIVTPNKIANSGNMSSYKRIHEVAKKRNVSFLYETNVGAGLPVINTLKDLLASGDSIYRIEAVLSGTLSYIFNTFDGSSKFSDVVKDAQQKGYTEPDPRVDLSGLDVARKLLILARETGLSLELKDIKIDSLLPADCMKAKTVSDFYKVLEKHNTSFSDKIKRASSKNNKLRFIAQLEKGKASIALKEVDAQHPFYNLSGSDNIISFTTERYHDRPLVVKGPGAGAEVTAAGVFAEIISCSRYLD